MQTKSRLRYGTVKVKGKKIEPNKYYLVTNEYYYKGKPLLLMACFETKREARKSVNYYAPSKKYHIDIVSGKEVLKWGFRSPRHDRPGRAFPYIKRGILDSEYSRIKNYYYPEWCKTRLDRTKYRAKIRRKIAKQKKDVKTRRGNI